MKHNVKKMMAVLAAAAALGVMPAVLPTVIPVAGVSVQAASVVDQSQYVKADGYGSMPAGVPIGRAKLMARKAAIMTAQAALVETVKGTAVDAESTMENFVLKSDVVKTKVSGMLTGAQIISEEITSDGNYHVVMAVPMYGVGSMADAAFSGMNLSTPQPIPAPSTSYTAPSQPSTTTTTTMTTTTTTAPTTAVSGGNWEPPHPATPINGGYTGLIIDVRGSNMIRAFAPNIFDANGRAIYSAHNVDQDYAIKYGIVGYADGQEAWNAALNGMARAGSHPLVIKATPKKRVVYNCDVVLSQQDAEYILSENQKTHFLENCAVTFLI